MPIIKGNKISCEKKLLAREFRKNPTRQEEEVWQWLRNKKLLGLKWRRQQIIQGFLADFYCHELHLVLELDGDVHNDPSQKEYDLERDNIFKQIGIKILRIANSECSLEYLTEKIKNEI